MAFNGRLQTIGKVTGVAASASPYLRRLATDEELRDDVADFVRSANNLMTHIRTDRRLRRDVQQMIESAQRGAGQVRADARPRRILRSLLVGTGLIIASLGIGIALAWPRARRQVTHVVDETTKRANATVRDIRGRMSLEGDSRAA